MVNINGIQKHKAFDMIMNRASGPYTTLHTTMQNCKNITRSRNDFLLGKIQN